MRTRPSDPVRRAGRLLRWYPADWRSRYGTEFSELLLSDLTERPHSPHRHADVVVGGLAARLADAGLVGTTIDPSRRPQRSLITFGCAVAVFVTVAASMWSHLDVAQRLSGPTTPATHAAIAIMTFSLFSCIALAAVGAAPIAWQTATAVGRRSVPGVRRPARLCLAGTATLFGGGVYFRNGWVVSGNHPWAHQVPGSHGAGAFLWAASLAVSAYWAHPTILTSLPVSEILWMLLSPFALVAAVLGAARTVRIVDLSWGVIRFASCLARVALVALGTFILGTLIWLVDGGPGPDDLFQAGTVDLIGLAILAVSLGLAARSAQRSIPLRCTFG